MSSGLSDCFLATTRACIYSLLIPLFSDTTNLDLVVKTSASDANQANGVDGLTSERLRCDDEHRALLNPKVELFAGGPQRIFAMKGLPTS